MATFNGPHPSEVIRNARQRLGNLAAALAPGSSDPEQPGDAEIFAAACAGADLAILGVEALVNVAYSLDAIAGNLAAPR